jgi:hypothetical protein
MITPPSGSMSLIGEPAELDISDMLQLFAAGKWSGRLTFSVQARPVG